MVSNNTNLDNGIEKQKNDFLENYKNILEAKKKILKNEPLWLNKIKLWISKDIKDKYLKLFNDKNIENFLAINNITINDYFNNPMDTMKKIDNLYNKICIDVLK